MGILDENFGALLIATSIALILYGITVLQTYFYFVRYYNDSPRNKLLVGFVWLLDSLHTALIIHFNYYYLVSSIGYPQQLQYGTWSFFISGAINFLLTFIVKSFYVMQIRQLCGVPWKWLTFVIMLSILAEFAFGMELTVLFFAKSTFALLDDIVKWRVITISGINLASDTAIVLALCIPLRNHKSDFPRSEINTTIVRIIAFCLQRFILCLIASVIELTVYLKLPDTMYAASCEIVFKKLYVNCLLAVLNSRQYLRGMATEEASSTDYTVTDYPVDGGRPTRTTITSLFRPSHRANGSGDDTGGFTLRTRDLEGSIESNKK